MPRRPTPRRRCGPGRKPIADKAIAVKVYIKASVVAAVGGIEKARELAIRAFEKADDSVDDSVDGSVDK